MTDARPIRVETQGRVGLIALHRPQQLNALNDALMDALGAALQAFDADPGIGAIVITGSDKAFAAGADIDAMQDWSYMDVYQSDFITRNWETIRTIRKPVLAAVAGYAMGGGCELALACDVIVAADHARFGLPEPRVGLMAGAGGVHRLPRHLPLKVAMGMMLTARQITAPEALRWGLVNEVVPAGELMAAAERWAREIIECAPLSIQATKEAAMGGLAMPVEEAMRYPFAAVKRLWSSKDAVEGPRAFAEKRKPDWSGE